jgi:hypothetical protein
MSEPYLLVLLQIHLCIVSNNIIRMALLTFDETKQVQKKVLLKRNSGLKHFWTFKLSSAEDSKKNWLSIFIIILHQMWIFSST